jgi:hypothetical protein
MRIIAFGCSYTYGHGLSDCLEDDKTTQGPTPSKFAFPSLLAKKLNCESINIGKSGNSNKEIWNDILNFKFQENDIAVIVWTYFSRFCIIKSDSIRRINPWKEEEKVFYMNYSNRHDMVLDFYGRLNHVGSYLNNIGIRNYNFVIEYPDIEIPSWSQTKVLGKFEMLDKAADDCHPGVISHATFSDSMYKIIHGRTNT